MIYPRGSVGVKGVRIDHLIVENITGLVAPVVVV
jgi:hypothetical protein